MNRYRQSYLYIVAAVFLVLSFAIMSLGNFAVPAVEAAPLAADTPTTQPTLPPTEVPPTEVPPTEVPPTEVPPTEVPPTEVPPTEVPPTEVPPTYRRQRFPNQSRLSFSEPAWPRSPLPPPHGAIRRRNSRRLRWPNPGPTARFH